MLSPFVWRRWEEDPGVRAHCFSVMPNLCIIPALALEKHQRGEITATDVVVLCAIGHHTDGKTGEGCWASVRTMCERSGIPRSTFFRCANKLLDAGLVTRESGRFEGTTSTYAIAMGGVPPVRLPSPAAETPVSHQQHSPTINAPFNDSSSSGLVPSEYEPDLAELLTRVGNSRMAARHSGASFPPGAGSERVARSAQRFG